KNGVNLLKCPSRSAGGSLRRLERGRYRVSLRVIPNDYKVIIFVGLNPHLDMAHPFKIPESLTDYRFAILRGFINDRPEIPVDSRLDKNPRLDHIAALGVVRY